MPHDVAADQLVIIRIDGMHCHKCEQAIQRALQQHAGVHEVEVDFASKQASVLFDRHLVNVRQLMDSVNQAGYTAVSFTQRAVPAAPASPTPVPKQPPSGEGQQRAC
jgi:copper chaperone CopZ